MRVKEATFATASGGLRDLPPATLPEIAFIGRSNVGKSSLINKLVGRKALARTSRTPGKTREINFYKVDNRFMFVDLPGFGYAKVSKAERSRWHTMIGRFVTERAPLRLVFHLVDGRHPPTPLDQEVMQLMREASAAYVILLTKTDKVSSNHLQKIVSAARRAGMESAGLDVPVVLTSAKEGRGVDDVFKWIVTYAGKKSAD